MNRTLRYVPEAKGNELFFLDDVTKQFSDDEMMDFANVYRSRRRDPMLILGLCLVGLLGFAGIHRFLTNNIGLGILYLLTYGLCLIGTIVDAVNYENIAFDYNRRVAEETAAIIRR